MNSKGFIKIKTNYWKYFYELIKISKNIKVIKNKRKIKIKT
jgi:hypothetical protein